MKQNSLQGALIVTPSPIFAFLTVFPLMFLCLLFLVLATLYYDMLILLSIILAIVMLYKYWFIRATVYRIDENTIRVTKGIITKRTDHLELFRVKDLSFQQGIAARLFKFEELTLYTTDLTSDVLQMKGIPKSLYLPDTIQDAVRRARIKNKSFDIELNN